MLDARGRVAGVEQHPLPYFTLRLVVPAALRPISPGQFVMVQVGEHLEPYLRRPFSVHDVVEDGPELEIHLLGKIVGRGTQLMATARSGDELSVLGPLGQGFRMPSCRRAVLVAGGVGSAALLLLGRRLLGEGQVFDFFYGARTAADLPRLEEFSALTRAAGGEMVVTTEDGSCGGHGLVTEPLAARLAAGRYDYLYACGPMGLLTRLAELGRAHAVEGEAALETAMGCGFGACLGCAVPHVEGHYALCCKDGPVFRFTEVRW